MRRYLFGIATATLLLSGSANAGVVTLYNSLSQPTIHPEFVGTYMGTHVGPDAESFKSGAVAETISNLTLDLSCNYLGVSCATSGGSFTVGLFAGSLPSPGSNPTSQDVPTGSAVSSFTVTDSQLAALDPTQGLQDFKFANPFGSTVLAANTTYWIELASGTTNTDVAWEFVSGTSGTGVAGNYWTVGLYDGSCVAEGASGSPCSYKNGGSSEPVGNSSFGMEIDAVPEPASLSLICAGLGGLGFLRRRKKM